MQVVHQDSMPPATEDDMSNETYQPPQQDPYDPYAETPPEPGYDARYDAEGWAPENGEYDYGYDYGTDMVSGVPDDAIQSAPDSGNKKKGISNRTKGIITLALVGVYLLWPVDIVPDVAVGLGQIDDAIVFAMGVTTILMRLRGPKK